MNSWDINTKQVYAMVGVVATLGVRVPSTMNVTTSSAMDEHLCAIPND
jgi:hypothetical protein